MMINFDEVLFCQEAQDFLDSLDEKSRNKVYYNIRKAQHVKDENLFKKIDEEIWEFRTLYNREKIRLFAFWHKEGDTTTVIVATHGIIKKRQKVGSREIDKARKIKRSYFESLNIKK